MITDLTSLTNTFGGTKNKTQRWKLCNLCHIVRILHLISVQEREKSNSAGSWKTLTNMFTVELNYAAEETSSLLACREKSRCHRWMCVLHTCEKNLGLPDKRWKPHQVIRAGQLVSLPVLHFYVTTCRQRAAIRCLENIPLWDCSSLFSCTFYIH